MTPEAIKAVVDIFQGLGTDARYIVAIVMGAMMLRIILIVGFLFFLATGIGRIIKMVVEHCSMTKGFQRDLGYIGQLISIEQAHIHKVWRLGLEKERESK